MSNFADAIVNTRTLMDVHQTFSIKENRIDFKKRKSERINNIEAREPRAEPPDRRRERPTTGFQVRCWNCDANGHESRHCPHEKNEEKINAGFAEFMRIRNKKAIETTQPKIAANISSTQSPNTASTNSKSNSTSASLRWNPQAGYGFGL